MGKDKDFTVLDEKEIGKYLESLDAPSGNDVPPPDAPAPGSEGAAPADPPCPVPMEQE